MSIISIQERNFNTNKNFNSLELSIQLSLNGFSYLISDSERYRAFHFEPLPIDIFYDDFVSKAAEFLEKEIFQNSFRKISILFSSFQSILLPEVAFNVNNLRKMFEVSHDINDDDMLSYNKIADFYLVFTLNSYISSVVANSLNKAIVYHHSFPVITKALVEVKNIVDSVVWINIQTAFFDILVFKNSKLVFSNSFRYKNVSDYIFFVMNIFEQLKLHPLRTKVLLMGKVQHDSAYFHSVCTFIKDVQLLKPDELFNQKSGNLIDGFYYHQHVGLFSMI
ncbi:MAG: DUF3822 family protein [Bacteroidales bacterium]|nr:DUF3822 family protein [Bacteroidales bacterium]